MGAKGQMKMGVENDMDDLDSLSRGEIALGNL